MREAEGDAELRARVEALREAGVCGWDAPGLQLAEALLQAAEGSPAAERLRLRATAHLDGLEAGFDHARARAREARDRLHAADAPGVEALDVAVERGDLTGALRAVRVRPQREPRTGDTLRHALRAQLDAEAESRGITSPGLIDAPDTEPAPALDLAESLYRDAAAGASARLALARTSTAVPLDAGRYHPVQVGARSLEAIEDSPHYLKAVLLRLQTLTTLWQHAEGISSTRRKPK